MLNWDSFGSTCRVVLHLCTCFDSELFACTHVQPHAQLFRRHRLEQKAVAVYSLQRHTVCKSKYVSHRLTPWREISAEVAQTGFLWRQKHSSCYLFSQLLACALPTCTSEMVPPLMAIYQQCQREGRNRQRALESLASSAARASSKEHEHASRFLAAEACHFLGTKIY